MSEQEFTATSWHSYPSPYSIGHRALARIFEDEVVVEEKVDGSQFSFGLYDGELRFRSRGQEIPDGSKSMFTPAIEYVKSVRHLLGYNWMYTGEFLSKPKHNTLAYERIPKNFIVLYDIRAAEETYLSIHEKRKQAEILGIEPVPILFIGKIESLAILNELMETKSCLGDVPIEGLVIKNYHKFGPDKKCLMGKMVSDKFKEDHKKAWKDANPASSDIIVSLGAIYKHENRWLKSLQHQREAGILTDSPKDIGPLIKEIMQDIQKENGEEIKNALYAWALPKIQRISVHGFPEWYKAKLAENQGFGA